MMRGIIRVSMKRIGLVAGLGPETTVDYYERLIDRYRALQPGEGYPAIVIDSLDIDYARGLLERGELDALTEYHVLACQRLGAAGAEVGALAANTSHIVFDAVAARSPFPLVSIVTAARNVARRTGWTRVALFGTAFTMEGGFDESTFAEADISVVVPSAEERARMQHIYYDELVLGEVLEASRAELLEMARRIKATADVDGLVLGGTELTLILKPEHEQAAGMPFLDTAAIHVDAILDLART